MSARTTKDIDLSLPELNLDIQSSKETIQKLWEDLQDAAARDLGDHFVIRDRRAPAQEFDAPREAALVFTVEVLLDGSIFAKFHLDVASAISFLSSPRMGKW